MEKSIYKNNGSKNFYLTTDSNSLKTRSISKIINSIKTTEGEGFIVHRPFPSSTLSYLDPFLLLDEMGPMDLRPGEAKGAPDHPHRGFETVTYMLDGSFEHKDSNGNSGKLNPGDVQWMTAGSGVIHSEMPSKEFLQDGGKLHGFQLWINLPKKDKMTDPFYQDVQSEKIPIVNISNGKDGYVKIIAGESFQSKSIINTKIPILYLHFTLRPGSRIVHPIPVGFNAFAYVIKGEGFIEEANGDINVNSHQMVIFNRDGKEIVIKVSDRASDSLDLLLIAGKPINEPIARYGPFVMNTQQEIYQAIDDYRNGRFGYIG